MLQQRQPSGDSRYEWSRITFVLSCVRSGVLPKGPDCHGFQLFRLLKQATRDQLGTKRVAGDPQ